MRPYNVASSFTAWAANIWH